MTSANAECHLGTSLPSFEDFLGGLRGKELWVKRDLSQCKMPSGHLKANTTAAFPTLQHPTPKLIHPCLCNALQCAGKFSTQMTEMFQNETSPFSPVLISPNQCVLLRKLLFAPKTILC